MPKNNTKAQSQNDEQLQDLVAQSDTGARAPNGIAKVIVLSVALAWALFQIYYASPLPFLLSKWFGMNFVVNDLMGRRIHLGFGVLLAFTAYPAYLHKIPSKNRIAGLFLLFSGLALSVFSIGKLSGLNTLLQGLEGVDPNLHVSPSLYLVAFAGLVLMVLGNPLLRRRWYPKNNIPGVILTLIGLGCLIYCCYSYTVLYDALTKIDRAYPKMIQLEFISTVVSTIFLLLAYPAFETPIRARISIPDWVIALLAAFFASYYVWVYESIVNRAGLPNAADLLVAAAGMVCLLEAARRSLGPALMIVAILFLLYTFFGPYMPELLSHKGASFSRVASHQWHTLEGVFGVPIGVSVKFVFLFVLFGALLNKAGAGNYLIQLSFSLLGHLRGGPAKAAILASGMTGLMSGSSIANVVTTGTFTIPLMKRVGFSGEKAGAVEVASSVNGQIMPPVMGAAAFLMIGYVGISYNEVIKHAFLPAVISYIALLYIVHLEALKANLQGIPKETKSTVQATLIRWGLVVSSLTIIFGGLYFMLDFVKVFLGSYTIYFVIGLITFLYITLMKYSSNYPQLEMDDPNEKQIKLPEVGPTLKSGLYYLIPIVLLVWNLMIEKLSPSASAFWAVLVLMIMVVTQPIFINKFRNNGIKLFQSLKSGIYDLFDGLVIGSRNMIGIAIATAVAGIVVGTVSLTGLGFKMIEFVEFISGGNLILVLVFTALISLILGMGLPTTANYAIVAGLMAPVVVALGANSGLVVPLIAVHLFVFYFGIMADVTPPVGLASFAAAAVSRADPLKTGVQAFVYSLRTVALPFIFIFNTQLLLIDVHGPFHFTMVLVLSTVAMLIFAAGTQGYFIVKSKAYESILLLLIAFTLFRPGYWMDMIYPEYNIVEPTEIAQTAEKYSDGESMRLVIAGEKFEKIVNTTILLPLGPQKDENGKIIEGTKRLEDAGLLLEKEDNKLIVDKVFGSPAEKAGINPYWELVRVEFPSDRPSKELFAIPALLLLGLIISLQRRRKPVLKTKAAA